MRPLGIAGIILILFGAFVLVRGGSFTTKRDVLRVGDVKVTADEQQTIPGWAGVLGIVAGFVLVVAGSTGKRP
jgi:drug/metabolite transporter (DMT)-like permease